MIDNIWYGKDTKSYLARVPLLPLSVIFQAVTALRRFLYHSNFFKSSAPGVPIVIIGGITVGGAGKTPLCVALVNALKKEGFHPGVLSRGYKAQTKVFPYQVKSDDDAAICGDEPLLIKTSTSAPVIIDPIRTRGALALAELGVDVIITDDGMQHYALKRDIEIVVLDGKRMLGNGLLMPAGPLREGKWRLNTVDAVVVNGKSSNKDFYSMCLTPRAPRPLNCLSDERIEPGALVCALAGIGNPQRFYSTLKDCGFIVADTIEAYDHECLDINILKNKAQTMPVVMTAKDGVKYQKHNLTNVFVLDVEADLSQQFYLKIQAKIKESKNRVALRQNKV